MNIETNKQDSANASASGLIENKALEERFAKLSQKAAKTLKVDGFRKGKVPPNVVKARFGDQIMQESEQDLVKEFVDLALKDLNIEQKDLLGAPFFLEYDKKEDGIFLKMRFALRPEVDISNTKKAVPEFKKPEVKKEEVEDRIKQIAKNFGELKELDRELQNGDIALIDFKGFCDGEAFKGGEAKEYSLEIGSGAFIAGFEEQLIGLKKGEEKEIKVTFPSDYGVDKLAGKDATFEVKVHKVSQREPLLIDDELAKKVLRDDENPNLKMLEDRIETQILNEKKLKLYNEELKEKLAESLVEIFDFDLPENIIEQEMDMLFRSEINTLPQEELESLQGKEEEVKERREKHREDAKKSVKMTLLIDSIAKDKKLTVSQEEIFQRIYFEAMTLRQDPKTLIEYYQKNGILPALQMTILQDKVLHALLEESIKE